MVSDNDDVTSYILYMHSFNFDNKSFDMVNLYCRFELDVTSQLYCVVDISVFLYICKSIITFQICMYSWIIHLNLAKTA